MVALSLPTPNYKQNHCLQTAQYPSYFMKPIEYEIKKAAGDTKTTISYTGVWFWCTQKR